MHDVEMSSLDDRIAALEHELAVCREGRSVAEEGELRLSLFLDSVQDFAFISFDLDGRVVGWSRGAERILDYPQVDAFGMYSGEFFTPEDVARGEDKREFRLAREASRAEDERWHLRRDGTRFWGSGVMTPLLDAQGRLCGFSKVLRDQTATKLAEACLRDSEERLRLFCENVHDYALIPVDLEGLVVGWNTGAARIFGYAPEEILGQHNSCFFNPEDIARGEPEQDLRRAVAEGRAEDARWMVHKDGSRFWSHWVTTPIRDQQTQLRGFAKVLHDSTERKAAEELRERLLEKERLLLQTQVRSTGEALDRTKEELRALAGSLLGAQEDERRRIARELHDDLSQRLAVLAIRLAALRDTLPDGPGGTQDEALQLEKYVAGLASEVRRLSHKLHPSILDDLGLVVAMRRLIEDFQASRDEPVTFIEREIPDDIAPATAAALFRIAQEGLRNVSKHAGEGPVRVGLEHESGALRLTIADAGSGFDHAAVRGLGGLGIISMQERAHLVGGSLNLNSRPGEGTTVEVRVPLTSDDDRAGRRRAAPAITKETR
ncbi:MAG: PAS domain-containing sensor histidine kinase [Nannocystis sp.]|nr:PAS domain-containing sensor histidine kinase [Nannocystis sp.]MBA3548676.1 PAS domain-containing sensor histidine kinase [Nannocystis sp.]